MNSTLLDECDDSDELMEMQSILEEELDETVRRAVNPDSSTPDFSSSESSVESSNGSSLKQMAQVPTNPDDVLEVQCRVAFEEFDTAVSQHGTIPTESMIARWIRDHHTVAKFQRRKLGIALRGPYDNKLENDMCELLFPTINPFGNDCSYTRMIYLGRTPAFDGLIRASECFGFRSSLTRALYTVSQRFIMMGANIDIHISYARFQSRLTELAESMPTMYHAWLSPDFHSKPLIPQFHYVEDPFTDEEDTSQFFNVINRAFYEVIHPDFSVSERGEPLEEIIKRKNDPRMEYAIFQAYQNFKVLIPQGMINMSEDACRTQVCELLQFLQLNVEESEAGQVENGYNGNSGPCSDRRDDYSDFDNAKIMGLPRGDIVRLIRGANLDEMPKGHRLHNDLAKISAQYNKALRSLQEER